MTQAKTMRDFLRCMASSSISPLGSLLGLWRRGKWAALALPPAAIKLSIISFSSWAHFACVCWMTLLILASRKASSLCLALVLAQGGVQLEASQPVVPSSDVQKGQGLVRIAPWWEIIWRFCCWLLSETKWGKLEKKAQVVRECACEAKGGMHHNMTFHGVWDSIVLQFTGLICLVRAFLTDSLEVVCEGCGALHTLWLLEMPAKDLTVQGHCKGTSSAEEMVSWVPDDGH